ncbi:ATP-binding protein [Myxococcaceae bacterium GXIMD 01537]
MSLVLVADDEPAVLEVLSQVVEDLGHDVIRARDGMEALELARARRPQLVVTDHMMPRLSGVDLCRRLRADETLKSVPVILLSAVLPQGAPEASAFIHKPFEITDFEALIRQSLANVPRPKPLEGVSAVEALGNWVAQTFQGSLGVAREQLDRLATAPGMDHSAAEALGAQLRAMEGVTHDLKEVARLAARSVTLELAPGDLGLPVARVVETWRKRAPRVPLTLSAPREPVNLRFDPERIEQVLDALLANAVHRSEGEGEVRVELQSTPSLVSLHVKDPGPGIPDEELPRLFELFHTGTSTPGAGLALYIASELARLHGGSLSAESRPGRGTTFSLVLPRA